MNQFILGLQARNLTVEIHHHSAYQIVLSNDLPFHSTINGSLHEGIYGFLIKPHVKHFCVAENGTLNVLNIEPYSSVGMELSGFFKKGEDHIIFCKPSQINALFNIAEHHADIKVIIEAILSKLPSARYDERVSKIADYIRDHYFRSDLTPQTFADMVFLSPSRLASLFKQQTGSSISKYLLWTRLRQAIYITLSDKERSLTDIAYDTGFYDLPQLNKYMYEMFGMPPKALKLNSDLIQIY